VVRGSVNYCENPGMKTSAASPGSEPAGWTTAYSIASNFGRVPTAGMAALAVDLQSIPASFGTP
jgi:hypothetical protein